MTRSEYLRRALDLWSDGKITEEVYDSMVMNADIFCDDDDDYDDRFSPSYCEIEYDDIESEEAVRGCAFDDMNFLRHFER